MSDQTHLQTLITNHTRRLQKLKEQQALTGFSTDPAILIEIQDIAAELKTLQKELAAIEDESEPHAQPEDSEETDSSDEYQTGLRHIEAQLNELQIKLVALERRFKYESHTEAAGAGDPQSEVLVQLPPGLKKFDTPQIALIQQLYQGEQQVLVEKEFGGGFGGTRVFLVRPIDRRGRQLARQIVKIGPPLALKREQLNYCDHVKKSHPFVAAEVARFAEGQGLGGIIYNFVGDGRLGQTRTLEEVFLDEQVSAEAINQTLTELLDKALGEPWYHQTEPYICFFDAEYGPHLVEHLRVRVRSASQDGLWPVEQAPGSVNGYHHLRADAISAEHLDIERETLVQIEGLVVTKVTSNLLKLQHPTQPGIVVKVETPEAMEFTVGQAVTIRGEILYTRPIRLAQTMTTAFANFTEVGVAPQAETLTWNGQTYPNPLHLYPEILSRTLDGKKSLVHGDLHLRNILVDESGHGWLIDFALVKERHNLYDFIKLEVFIRQMVLSQPQYDFSYADYLQFEEALLDETVPVPDDPILRKAYQVIRKVRELAAQYVRRDFAAEYLPGLFLYSLAVVKYVDSHGVKAARLAFGTAAVVGKVLTKSKSSLVSFWISTPRSNNIKSQRNPRDPDHSHAIKSNTILILCLQTMRKIAQNELLNDVGDEFNQDNMEVVSLDFTDLVVGKSIPKPVLAIKRLVSPQGDLNKSLNRLNIASLIFHGIAHIPLLVLTGYLVTDRQPVRLYDFHPGPNLDTWSWPDKGESFSKLDILGMPQQPNPDIESVVVRVSVSYEIVNFQTERAVPNADLEIDLSVANPRRNIVSSERQVRNYGSIFRQILDLITQRFFNVKVIHLFYAGPSALAFHLGQQISENIHPRVMVWNYRNTQQGYEWAVDLTAAISDIENPIIYPKSNKE